MISSVASAHPSPIKLLLVEDDQIDRLAFTRCVKQAGLPYDYTLAGSLTEALSILNTQIFEIAILDYNLGDGNATDLFPILRAQNCPFVISTGSGDEETAARLMGEGAVDYLIKDPERNYLQVLPATVTKALARYQAEDQLRLLSHAIQSVKDGIYIVDTNGQLLFTNDALKVLCDRRQTNVVGRPIHILGQPALTERVTMADPCIGSSCALDVEIPLHQADGSAIPMLLSECWIQDESDRIRVGVMRDITSLKQVELSLRHAQENLEQMVEERTAQLQAAIAQLQEENQERLKAEAALRASRDLIQQQQDFLRLVIDSNPNLIFVKDWDGQFLLANQAMAEFSGTTVDTLVGKFDGEIKVPPEEAERYLRENRQVMTSGQTLFFPEEKVYREGQGEQWQQWYKRPIQLPDSTIMGVLGVGVNITARKQVELSLQESEQRLSSLAAAVPVGIFRTDRQGNCVYVNDRWCEISGLNPEEAFRQGWLQALHPEDHVAVAAEWHQAIQDNCSFKGEYRFRREDGTITWVYGQASPEYDANAQVIGYVGTITNISDRKQTEEALRQSEARWQFALEGAGDGLWDWNIQTNIVFFSSQWKTMLGYTTDEVGDRLEEWDSRVHPDDKIRCYAELDKHFRGEIPTYQVEHRVRCQDGSYKWILARGKIIEWTPEGQPLRIIGTHTDISDRKQAEDALRTSEAYQRALVRSLPDLVIRLDQQGTYLEFIAPPAFRVVGGSRKIGTNVYDTLPLHLAQQRMAAVHTANQTGVIQFYEQDLSVDGNLQIEEVRVVPYGEAEALLLIRDISDRKRAELTLQKLVTGTAAVTGEDFFPALVSHIAEALEVRYALVTEWVGDKLYTLGFWAHGALQPAISYLPARTPCECALREGEFHCESLVQTLFPEDIDLVTMQADSYLGIALKDDRGHAIGNLCILDVKPLSPAKRDEVLPILQVFAARAVAELQRKRANDALYQLNQDLEARVEQRTAELQEREAQLRDFFDNASDLIQSIAPDGRVLFVNRAWKETLGYDDADLAQISIFQIIHPDDLAHCQTAMQRLFMGESCLGIETRFLTKDAREIVVEGNVNCQTRNGVPIATRGIFRDITDRKQAEHALRESQQFLQTVLDTFPLAVFWKDLNSIYLGCNHNFLQDAGLTSAAELIGKTDDDMPWNTSETAAYQSDDQQVIDSGTAKLGIIEPLHTAEGEMIWLETNKLPLRNLKGEVIGVLGTYQNITDRKAAEAALAASESFNRQLVEEFPIGLASCRLDGQLVYVNSAFAKMLGRTIEETLNLSYWDITPIQYAEQEAEQLQALQQHGRYGPYEKEYIHKDGYLVPVLLTGLIILQNGEELIWSSAQDISDRKKAEAQLQHTNEELARATRLKDEFLANMSHELRTPLNAILGMTEGLQDEVFGMINAQQTRALHTIETSATHLLSLINDILDVAKIESGQIELEYAAISVNHLCSSSLAFIKQLALQKRIQLETRIADGLPHLVVDELRIRQVLINLLTNAVKFTPEGGRVTLSASQVTEAEGTSEQHYLRIAVTDTGIGIAPDNISKLFQPFVQIDSALNRQHAGTGLGLALVKQIVELHGGRVGLTSEWGVGSCFSIDLPCVPEENLEPSQTMPSIISRDATSPTALHPTAQSPLILLAEDNPANISTIVSYLEAKGYRVLLARNGQEAVDLTQSASPDLILMDIQMPGMDGIEAMQQIRQDSSLIHIPIIALTALAMKGDRERCLEAGANDYLSKPVRLKQLAAMIHQFLTSSEEGV